MVQWKNPFMSLKTFTVKRVSLLECSPEYLIKLKSKIEGISFRHFTGIILGRPVIDPRSACDRFSP